MIPVNQPLLGEEELANVTETLRTGWISSSGRFIDAFEGAWAEYCGMRYGVAVSNGTTALQVAVACLDLEPGDEVILPSFTIISCAQAVVYNGGTPVLVDSDPRTWCMDVNQVEDRITPRTRAIMPVHIYGHPVDMDPIIRLAERHGLRIIEDAAEAHGGLYLADRGGANESWRRCGGLGDISTFSFYANKLVTTGEGGMLLTQEPDLAERARALRNLCFRRDRRFYHTELGNNYRLTNIQAAIGLAQVGRIERTIERKRRMGQAYARKLGALSGFQLPVEESWAKQVYWMYGMVLDEATGIDATEMARRLADRGVETRPFFLGMHEQPVFRRMGLFENATYPVAERLARQGLYLPSGVALTDEQIDEVCHAVEEALA
jgi:perosamine synthetase